MRKERKSHAIKSQKPVGFPELASLCVSFLLGTLLGCLCAGHIPDSEGSAIASYMENYLAAAGEGRLVSPGLISVLLETFRWPFVVMLLSCTVIGLVGIPIVFCIRSFLLSFAVATFIRVLGSSGIILSLVLFGMTGILSLPVLFVMGARGLSLSRMAAAHLMGRKNHRILQGNTYFTLCGACAIILLFCAFLEQTVVSSIVEVLAGIF